jgi:hypothetical protein
MSKTERRIGISAKFCKQNFGRRLSLRVQRSTARHTESWRGTRPESAHWQSANEGTRGPATQGNLDSTNHAQQGIQGFTKTEITATEQGGKSFELGVDKMEQRARVLNLRVLDLCSDIALVRKETPECSGANSDHRKNREFSKGRAVDFGIRALRFFGDVEGSEKWKRISFVVEQHIRRIAYCLPTRHGVTSFCLTMLPKPI